MSSMTAMEWRPPAETDTPLQWPPSNCTYTGLFMVRISALFCRPKLPRPHVITCAPHTTTPVNTNNRNSTAAPSTIRTDVAWRMTLQWVALVSPCGRW